MRRNLWSTSKDILTGRRLGGSKVHWPSQEQCEDVVRENSWLAGTLEKLVRTLASQSLSIDVMR